MLNEIYKYQLHKNELILKQGEEFKRLIINMYSGDIQFNEIIEILEQLIRQL